MSKKNKKKVKKPAAPQDSHEVSEQQTTTQGKTGSSAASTSGTGVPAQGGAAPSPAASRSTDWSAFSEALRFDLPSETPTRPSMSDDDSPDDKQLVKGRNKLDEEMEPGDVPIMSLPAHLRVMEVEYRINRILKREGEQEITLPIIDHYDYSVDPPLAVYNVGQGHPQDNHRRTEVLLQALRWKKPHVYRRVTAMLNDYNRRMEDRPPPVVGYKAVP